MGTGMGYFVVKAEWSAVVRDSGEPLKYTNLLRIAICFICIAFALTGCDAGGLAASSPVPPKRILLIGNSYTFYNGGLDEALKGLAPASTASRIAVGGYTLENQWETPDTVNAIHNGKWDDVVLQEQSQTPIVDPGKFYEYAGKLNQEVKNSGAETILLMTWERPDSVSYGVTTAALAEAYDSAGASLGAKVAPAGLAFAEALREDPNISLYSQDGHPTVEGTYLAACVLYETIFGKSPVGIRFADSGITEEDKTFLQNVAAEFITR